MRKQRSPRLEIPLFSFSVRSRLDCSDFLQAASSQASPCITAGAEAQKSKGAARAPLTRVWTGEYRPNFRRAGPRATERAPRTQSPRQ